MRNRKLESGQVNKKLLWWERAQLEGQLFQAPIGIDDDTNLRYRCLVRSHQLSDNGGVSNLLYVIRTHQQELFYGETVFTVPSVHKKSWLIVYLQDTPAPGFTGNGSSSLFFHNGKTPQANMKLPVWPLWPDEENPVQPFA